MFRTDAEFSEYLEEMHTIDSDLGPCVMVFHEDADKVINHCRRMGAAAKAGNDELFIVDIRRGVGPEVYYEWALRKTLARRVGQ